MITLTIPTGPDLIAKLAASAAQTGLPVDEHAENLLRAALELPTYAREGGQPTVPQTRTEEVTSAVEKALRQELALAQRHLQTLRETVRRHLPVLDVRRNVSQDEVEEVVKSLRWLANLDATQTLTEADLPPITL